jgi:succinyl-CoA synthetase beta subunit
LIYALAATRELPTQQVDREPDGRLVPAICAQERLSAAGIPVLPLVEIKHAEALDEVISQLKPPLVLKLADEEHRHPEDVVIVVSRQEAHEAFDRLAKRGDVVAQALAEPGLEFYIGINHDSVCGPVFMIGAGGPTLEAQRDVAMTIGFPDRRRVKACLAETGCGRWVLGSLGSRLVDTELLVDIALKAVTVARDMSESFAALDINPVVIGPWGGAVVDAKLRVRSGTADYRSGGPPCTP